jgi:hypothetical protein
MVPPRPRAAGDAPARAGHAARTAVTAVVARRFATPEREHHEAARTFLRSAVPAAGVVLDATDLRDARGHAYADMAAAVLGDVLAGRPLDLLVLAHVVPDLALEDVATISAGELVGGVGASFGVSDQGSLAPFTALHLADVFAARQGLARAAVVVVDQHVLPYRTDRSAAQQLVGDAAVALLLEPAPDAGLRLAHRTGLHGADDDAWRRAVAAVRDDLVDADAPPPTVVVGAGADTGWLGPLHEVAGDVTHAGPGYPCSGVWQALAASSAGTGGAPVLVLEADPLVGAVHGALLAARPA